MEAELVTAFILSAIEREVGFHHDSIDVRDFAAIGHDADAGGGLHLVAIDGIRPRNDIADFGRQRFDVGGVGDVVLQHGEFVAAETGDHVGLAHAAAHALADRAQQGIADRVAERVVDVLEMVEVEIMHGESIAAAPRAGEFQIEPLKERRPVGEPSQRVGAGERFDLLHKALALGDVMEEPDAAEIFLLRVVQRAGVALEELTIGGFDLVVALHFRMLRRDSAPVPRIRFGSSSAPIRLSARARRFRPVGSQAQCSTIRQSAD